MINKTQKAKKNLLNWILENFEKYEFDALKADIDVEKTKRRIIRDFEENLEKRNWHAMVRRLEKQPHDFTKHLHADWKHPYYKYFDLSSRYVEIQYYVKEWVLLDVHVVSNPWCETTVMKNLLNFKINNFENITNKEKKELEKKIKHITNLQEKLLEDWY